MKSQPSKRIATKALVFAALMWCATFAWAGQVAGTVRHLSGPLIAKKADGRIKVLALRSEVEQGDTLVSEKNTYALIRFIDNSEITLRPDSSFKIESFAFDEAKPDGDSATFDLVKGGLRSVTGMLGKRNKEKFLLKTPTATIGIRGTTFVAQFVQNGAGIPTPTAAPGAPAAPGLLNSLGTTAVPRAPTTTSVPAVPGAPALSPGLHVFVIDGMIQLSNPGGSQSFAAGQFGYVPSHSSPPIIVPANPGLKFTPPPTFSLNSGTPNSSGAKPPAVDCEVR